MVCQRPSPFPSITQTHSLILFPFQERPPTVMHFPYSSLSSKFHSPSAFLPSTLHTFFNVQDIPSSLQPSIQHSYIFFLLNFQNTPLRLPSSMHSSCLSLLNFTNTFLIPFFLQFSTHSFFHLSFLNFQNIHYALLFSILHTLISRLFSPHLLKTLNIPSFLRLCIHPSSYTTSPFFLYSIFIFLFFFFSSHYHSFLSICTLLIFSPSNTPHTFLSSLQTSFLFIFALNVKKISLIPSFLQLVIHPPYFFLPSTPHTCSFSHLSLYSSYFIASFCSKHSPYSFLPSDPLTSFIPFSPLYLFLPSLNPPHTLYTSPHHCYIPITAPFHTVASLSFPLLVTLSALPPSHQPPRSHSRGAHDACKGNFLFFIFLSFSLFL